MRSATSPLGTRRLDAMIDQMQRELDAAETLRRNLGRPCEVPAHIGVTMEAIAQRAGIPLEVSSMEAHQNHHVVVRVAQEPAPRRKAQ